MLLASAIWCGMSNIIIVIKINIIIDIIIMDIFIIMDTIIMAKAPCLYLSDGMVTAITNNAVQLPNPIKKHQTQYIVASNQYIPAEQHQITNKYQLGLRYI